MTAFFWKKMANEAKNHILLSGLLTLIVIHYEAFFLTISVISAMISGYVYTRVFIVGAL